MTRQIPLSKGKVALVDDEDYERVNQYRWCFTDVGYAVGYAGGDWSGGKQPRHISMHRFILDAPPHLKVDHINGNGLDNRRANLRYATTSQNAQNKRGRKSGTSRYKGVYWDKQRNRWRAVVILNGKHHHGGDHRIEEDAARAYDRLALKLFGEYARFNLGHPQEAQS